MSSISNVTLQKKANVYFDGKVTSRSFTLADGSSQSLGIMLPGEYEFGTNAAERMDILTGELEVLLPGKDKWEAISGGMSFEIPSSSKFQVKVSTITDYLCSYIK